MGAEIVKAISQPFESAVHNCSQIPSESDCESGYCTTHWKTIGADAETGAALEEIEIQVYEEEVT